MIEPSANTSETDNGEAAPAERRLPGSSRTWSTPTVSRLNVAATEFNTGSLNDSEGFMS